MDRIRQRNTHLISQIVLPRAGPWHDDKTRQRTELSGRFFLLGTFSAVGVIREPTLALSVAINDLLLTLKTLS